MLVISTRPSSSRFTGWLAPRWPWNILLVLPPTASASIWCPRQMPNSGFLVSSILPDHRHRIFARRRRVARAVRQEEAVRLVRHDLFERRGRRNDRHPGSGLDQQGPEDVALVAIIHRNDVGARILPLPRAGEGWGEGFFFCSSRRSNRRQTLCSNSSRSREEGISYPCPQLHFPPLQRST